jgi:hypothetical protein
MVGIVAFVILVNPGLAHAALAITPSATVSLGSVAAGTTTVSGKMGAVTVTASALTFPSFTATVSTTNFAGPGGRTIDKSSIYYWSGPATPPPLLQNATPGQLTAADKKSLASPVTAFSSVGLALSITTTWNPTIVIDIPTSAVAGTYSGTITYSVV